jgi:phytoene synthase
MTTRVTKARTDRANAAWRFPNPATPEGSDTYYATRFAPPANRDRLALVFAWRQELEHIGAKASDPGITRLKLDWWREELVRAQTGRPRHPLARPLSEWLASWSELTPWLAMLDGMENRIRKLSPHTTSEFQAQCQRLGGSLGWLIAGADAQPTAAQTSLARRLMAYREAVHCVRDLARHTQHEFCPLPLDALDAAGLARHQLQLDTNAKALARCLDELLGSSDWVFGEARQGQSAGHPATAPSVRLAVQAALLHRKIAKQGYPVFRDHIELTPLRRLWAAWRLR